MFFVDEPAADATPEAPPAAATEGWFRRGNPALGRFATPIRWWWLNMVQAELAAFLTRAGITRSKTDQGQVLTAAVTMLGGGRVVRVSSSGNVTIPVWAKRALVRMWGGGGGAGSSANNGSAGGGGGGAAYLEVLVSGLTSGADIACAVGGGGLGGTGTSAGGNGGTTSFGTFASCTGGTGGGYASGAPSTASGSGGEPTSAEGVVAIVTHLGTSGSQGYPNGSVGVVGAWGGSSFASGPVPPPTSDLTTPKIGFGGAFPGQGGCSGVNGGTGGSGGNGLMIIEWLA